MSKTSKIAISIVAILIAIAHVTFPTIAIDATTLILLFVALVPWILPFVKSIDIPGVGSIDLQDAKSATDKVMKTITPPTGSISVTGEKPSVKVTIGDTDITNLWTVFEADPNLALVGFRIEIERRLRQITEKAGIEGSRKPLCRLARELEVNRVLPAEVVSGIVEMSHWAIRRRMGRPLKRAPHGGYLMLAHPYSATWNSTHDA